MVWIPTDLKIVNFAKNWLNNMLIPETTDLVLGEDDPGVTPIAIGAMGSASGQAFAYLSNNLQYLHDITVIDDVTINVTSVSELQDALDILDRVIYVHKDKVFTINIAAGTYVWPAPGSEARSALHAYGIHGGGSVLFSVAGVTIEGECTTNRPLIKFMDCTCNLVISGALTISNDTNGSTRGVTFDNVRQVTALDLEIRNKSSAHTLTTGIYCREADFVDLGLTINVLVGLSTNVARAIFARQNSRIYFDTGNLTIGKLSTEVFHLEKNSQVLFENFDSCLPLGADTAFIHDAPADVDPSSRIAMQLGSSSGSGTSTSPYLITIAWESATDTPKLIQYILGLLPRPLDAWIKLKFPAGTLTESIVIKDFDGRGGLQLEANTALVAKGTGQDTIIDDNDECINIERCRIPVLLHSFKLDNENGPAALRVSSCRDVRAYFMWLRAPTGTGGSQYYGNGVYAQGVSCKVLVSLTYVGTCNQNGVYSDNGASCRLVDVSNEDLLNLPAQYGQFARNSGAIYRSNTGGKYIAGGVGIDSENEGGKVFNS